MAILSRTAGILAILSLGAVAVTSCQTWQGSRGYARWSERVKARIVEQVDAIGRSEITRLNAANETYKTQIREDRPPAYDGSYKAYDEYESYSLVDIQTTHSIFFPLRAIIEFEYVRYETTHRHLFSPDGFPLVKVSDPYSLVRKDMDFRPIERKTRGFEYSFDTNGLWSGERGKQLW